MDEPNNGGGDNNKPNPAEAFQNLLAKNNNDATKLAAQLHDENYHLREKMREMKKSQPKDGAVTLSDADAKEFADYQKLKIEKQIDLKQITSALGEVETLKTQNKELSRAESERDAADAAGFKLSTFRKLMRDFPDAELEVKQTKAADGKESKTAFIRNGDKESPLTEFAETNFTDFLPALKQGDTVQQQPKTGNTPDPKVYAGNVEAEAEQKAKAAQESATYRRF